MSRKTGMEYQGWANYATWAMARWIDNDRDLHDRRRALLAEVNANGGRLTSHRFADALEEWMGGSMPDLGPSVWSDILTHALAHVDWRELAMAWMDEAAEQAADTADGGGK